MAATNNGSAGAKVVLPPGKPRNWPNSNEAELEARPSRHINFNTPQEFSYVGNTVKTSKYEYYNFLPKFLMEAFNPRVKIANCYFLMIAGLQCIPVISNTGGYPTTLLPLTVVVVIDAVFQILEDMTRHRADRDANNSTTQRLNRDINEFEDVLWSNLEVGDIVKIRNYDVIPADVLCLGVAERADGAPTNGMCYVETKSLDGETNLKIRMAMPSTMNVVKDATTVCSLRGYVDAEHPNKVISSFSGILDLGTDGNGSEANRVPIQVNNVLLRGCVLRNTEFVIGLVLNTGVDTKVMMSNTKTKPKSSYLEQCASMQITKVICLLAVVCFAGATGQAIWNDVNNVEDIAYLNNDNPSPIGYWFVHFFYFFLLHATFIPVSLYVSMAIVRFYQSYFMNNDLDMYYEPLDCPALVRTMTLNEELGQISYVFTDKTGTLTCNNMDFRKMSVAGVAYGVGITEIGKASWKLQNKAVPPEVLEGEEICKSRTVAHVSFYDPAFESLMYGVSTQHSPNCVNTPTTNTSKASYNNAVSPIGADDHRQRELVNDFFRALALCHDVIVEKVNGANKLSASNPDDEALVCAAEYFGYQFSDRKDKFVILHTGNSKLKKVVEQTSGSSLASNNNTNNNTPTVANSSTTSLAGVGMSLHSPGREQIEEEIEMLESIEFSSKRKRMSVIIRDNNKSHAGNSNSKNGGECVRLLCKGADTVMYPRFNQRSELNQTVIRETEKHMTAFADEGLRCLYIASAYIPVAKYEEWAARYRAARSDLNEIDKKKAGLDNRIEALEDEIEQNLGTLTLYNRFVNRI
jgi:phospholipid-transporting ATPase